MAIPDLNTHLDYKVVVHDDATVRKAVDILLDLPTCFAVIGGEGEIRTTERGMKALEEKL